MVLHLFISFLGGVPLCIPYGWYSGTSLGETTGESWEGFRVGSCHIYSPILSKSNKGTPTLTWKTRLSKLNKETPKRKSF